MLDVPIPAPSLRCLSSCNHLVHLSLKADFDLDYSEGLTLIEELQPTWSRLRLFALALPSIIDSAIFSSWIKLLDVDNLQVLWLFLDHVPKVDEIVAFSRLKTFGLTLTSKASTAKRTTASTKAYVKSLTEGLPHLQTLMVSGDGVQAKSLQLPDWSLLKGLKNTLVLYKVSLTDDFARLIVPEIRRLAPTVKNAISYFNGLFTTLGSHGRLLSLHIDDGAALDWLLQVVHSNKAWSLGLTGHLIYALLLSRAFCHSASRAITFARRVSAQAMDVDADSEAPEADASSAPASLPKTPKKPIKATKKTPSKSKKSFPSPPPSDENHWLVCDLFWQLSLEARHQAITPAFRRALIAISQDDDLLEALEMAVEELSLPSTQALPEAQYQLRRFSLMQFICLVHFGANCFQRNRSFITRSDKLMSFLAGPWRRHCPNRDFYLNNVCIALRWTVADRAFCKRLIEFGFLREVCDYLEVDTFNLDIETPPMDANYAELHIGDLYDRDERFRHKMDLFLHYDASLGTVLANVDASQVPSNADHLAKIVLALPRTRILQLKLDVVFLVSLPHVNADGNTVLCRALQSYLASPYHSPWIGFVLGALQSCEHCRKLHRDAMLTSDASSSEGPKALPTLPNSLIKHFSRIRDPLERVPILLSWLSAVPPSDAQHIAGSTFQAHLNADDPYKDMEPQAFLENAINYFWETRGDHFSSTLLIGPLNPWYFAASTEVGAHILSQTSFHQELLTLISSPQHSIPALAILHTLMLKPSSAAYLVSFLSTMRPAKFREDCPLCESLRVAGTLDKSAFHHEDLVPDIPDRCIAHVLSGTRFELNPPRLTEDSSLPGLKRYRGCCIKCRFVRALAISGCSSADYAAGQKPMREHLTLVVDQVLYHFLSRVGDKKSDSLYYERMCDLVVRLLDASAPLLSAWQHSPFVLPILEFALSSSFDNPFLVALVPLVRKSILPKGSDSMDARTASRFPPFIARILRTSAPDGAA